jgi:hypothetical protein
MFTSSSIPAKIVSSIVARPRQRTSISRRSTKNESVHVCLVAKPNRRTSKEECRMRAAARNKEKFRCIARSATPSFRKQTKKNTKWQFFYPHYEDAHLSKKETQLEDALFTTKRADTGARTDEATKVAYRAQYLQTLDGVRRKVAFLCDKMVCEDESHCPFISLDPYWLSMHMDHWHNDSPILPLRARSFTRLLLVL